MGEYFLFPFRFEDLLEETTDSRYVIQSVNDVINMDERRIKRKLNELEKAFAQEYLLIKEPERFDFLYFWIM